MELEETDSEIVHPATLHPATLHPATLYPATPHPETPHPEIMELKPTEPERVESAILPAPVETHPVERDAEAPEFSYPEQAGVGETVEEKPQLQLVKGTEKPKSPSPWGSAAKAREWLDALEQANSPQESG